MVQINEIVVRAIIVEDATQPSKGLVSSVAAMAMTDEARTALIDDCVRQVLAILERQTER